MAYVIGKIIGTIIGAAFGAFLGALIIQFATKIVVKFKPGYWMAYKASFIAVTSSSIVNFVIVYIIGSSGTPLNAQSIIILMIVGFFVGAAVYGTMIQSPDNMPIGIGNASLISLVQLIIGGLIFGAILFVWVMSVS